MKCKFRVWDKCNKEWATDFTLTLNGNLLCDGGSTLFIKDNFELNQWTGLQDADEQDIYEGDILAIGPVNYKVMFEKGCFCLHLMENHEHHMIEMWRIKHYVNVKIAGNIYEELID